MLIPQKFKGYPLAETSFLGGIAGRPSWLFQLQKPETNSSPLKIGHPKRKQVFQPSIFRCKFAVSFREGKGTHGVFEHFPQGIPNISAPLWTRIKPHLSWSKRSVGRLVGKGRFGVAICFRQILAPALDLELFYQQKDRRSIYPGPLNCCWSKYTYKTIQNWGRLRELR